MANNGDNGLSSPMDFLKDVDFNQPEARFRALELALVETANCGKQRFQKHEARIRSNDKKNQETKDLMNQLTKLVHQNTNAIKEHNGTIKVLSKMIFATFGVVLLSGLGVLADKIWGIF